MEATNVGQIIPRRGTWSKAASRPINQKHGEGSISDRMAQRGRSSAIRVVHPDDLSKEKKQKVEEETKALRFFMATHLGSIEVVEQPRQVQ